MIITADLQKYYRIPGRYYRKEKLFVITAIYYS